jgi:integrase
MASIVTPKTQPKHRWIQFTAIDGARKTLRLGKSNNRDAEQHQRVVETILNCQSASLTLEPEIAKFIGVLPAVLRKRYIACGLISASEPKPIAKNTLLGPFLTSYFDSRAMDVKESSQIVFSHTHKRLIEFFKADKPLKDITASDARDFRKWLASTNKRDKPKEGEQAPSLSLNTVKRRTGFCKQAFAQAVADGIIDRNPFAGMASSVRSNKERQEYVDLTTFNQVLAKAPNARWRALLVLARLGAFRIPSEAQGLKWDHVAWDAKRISVVDSSKTEHHAKRAIRIVPMLPAIEKELLAWFAEAPDGDYVFPGIHGDTNLRTQLEKIITRAGLKQWPKLWQNLRASGCTDFARTLPSHIAAAICGHTEQIAKEHYWQVTDSDMTEAMQKMSVQKPEVKPEAVSGGFDSQHIAGVKPEATKTLKTNEIIGGIVDDIGLEPTTPTMSTWCSNQLS